MENTEFKNEFDIGYNNIRSNGAPGIDDYELSVFLTKAQDEIVFNTFNPLGNKYQDGFENTEKRRRDLKQLLKNYNTDVVEQNPTNIAISGFDSYNIELPADVYFIVQEQAIIDFKEMGVIPIKHDEIMLQKDNPYRKPIQNSFFNRVWRLDNNLTDTYAETVELIVPSGTEINNYSVRYIKSPRPIIVTDLNSGEFEGLGLTIKGVSAETTCELDEIVHRQILDRAITLALEAFEKQRLQTQSQISSRNE